LKIRVAEKNLLFVELVVVILFFSIAAAVCVSLFGQAYSDSRDSRDLTEAVITAQNVAEYYKATGEILEIEGNHERDLKIVVDSTNYDEYIQIVIFRSVNRSGYHEENSNLIFELTVRRIP
jgi:flagellar basal body-associated protein FliL